MSNFVLFLSLHFSLIFSSYCFHKNGSQHGDFVRAVKCFTEILVRNKERHGKISEQVGIDLHNIGVVQIRGGLFTDALSICQEAVNVRKAVLGPNHPDVAVSK